MNPKSYFEKYENTLRQYAKLLGKRMKFVVSGENIQLHREDFHSLRSCVVHLLKNALDHGIEMPDRRRDLGKPIRGLIEINLKTVNGTHLILVKDDGTGMSLNLQKNIFFEGFSSRKEVNILSGRGIGLSIVREKALLMGGAVKCFSEPVVGTTFVLSMPQRLEKWVFEGQK